MILPLVLSFLLVGRIKPLARVLLGYSFLAILGGVVVTFSRAGWAADSGGFAGGAAGADRAPQSPRCRPASVWWCYWAAGRGL